MRKRAKYGKDTNVNLPFYSYYFNSNKSTASNTAQRAALEDIDGISRIMTAPSESTKVAAPVITQQVQPTLSEKQKQALVTDLLASENNSSEDTNKAIVASTTKARKKEKWEDTVPILETKENGKKTWVYRPQASYISDGTKLPIKDMTLDDFLAESEYFDKHYYPVYDEELPYLKEKSITLSNAGPATNAVVSTNQLDSIAKYAKIAGIPIFTALGHAVKESTLGNPTENKDYYRLMGMSGKDIKDKAHIQDENSKLKMSNWLNLELHQGESGVENSDKYNPYLQQIGAVMRQLKTKGIPITKENIWKGVQSSIGYARKLAKQYEKANKRVPILQAAFATYKKNPYGYNPHQSNYVEMVNQNAKKIAKSPEIQQWYNTSNFVK